MDPISAVFTTFGVILLAVSWIYLIFISFEDDYNWGLCAIFLPFIAYLYALFNWKRSQPVLITAVLGLVVILLGM